jgi:hypothetical protein
MIAQVIRDMERRFPDYKFAATAHPIIDLTQEVRPAADSPVRNAHAMAMTHRLRPPFAFPGG